MLEILRIERVSKSFGKTKAINSINLQVKAGQLHVILGEHGSGKSTLARILAGILTPDDGIFFIEGRQETINKPQKSLELSIGFLINPPVLFPHLSVIENVMLFHNNTQKEKLLADITSIANQMEWEIKPQQLIAEFAKDELYQIDMVRALVAQPKILIIDDALSHLSKQELNRCYLILKNLMKEGMAVIYTTEKITEAFQLADEITLLQKGRKILNFEPKNKSVEEIATILYDKSSNDFSKILNKFSNKILLKVNDLSLTKMPSHLSSREEVDNGTSLKSIHFQLAVGQVLGIAGFDGNGQQELFAALSGEVRVKNDAIIYKDLPIGNKLLIERRKLNISFVPKQRLDHAVGAELDVLDNTFLSLLAKSQSNQFGVIKKEYIKGFAEHIIKRYDIQVQNLHAAISELSIDSLQKFIFGRELLLAPDLFILHEPTLGLDLKTKNLICQKILEGVENGISAVIISNDLDLLFEICDNIAILSDGILSEAKDMKKMTRDSLESIMTGLRKKDDLPLLKETLRKGEKRL